MYFKYFVQIFVLGVLLSCSKKTHDFSDVGVLGHAATGLFNPSQLFPQNSKEGVEYILSFTEVAGVELDVQFSKDGELWLFHDDNLDNKTNKTGSICEKSESEMQTVHYNSLNKEKVATINSVDFNKTNGFNKVFLDIKLGTCTYDFNVFNVLKTNLDELQAKYINEIEFILILNNNDLVSQFLAEGYSVFSDVNSYQNALTKLEGFELDGFFIRHNQLTKEEVKILQEMGKEVVLFEMRTPFAIRKALEKSPDFIMVEEVKTAIVEKYN